MKRVCPLSSQRLHSGRVFGAQDADALTGGECSDQVKRYGAACEFARSPEAVAEFVMLAL